MTRGYSLTRSAFLSLAFSKIAGLYLNQSGTKKKLTSLCLRTQYRISIVQLPALIKAPSACDIMTPTVNKTAFRTSKSHIGIIHSVHKLTSISSVPVPLIIRGSFNPKSSCKVAGLPKTPRKAPEKTSQPPRRIFIEGFGVTLWYNRGPAGNLPGEFYIDLKRIGFIRMTKKRERQRM